MSKERTASGPYITHTGKSKSAEFNNRTRRIPRFGIAMHFGLLSSTFDLFFLFFSQFLFASYLLLEAQRRFHDEALNALRP